MTDKPDTSPEALWAEAVQLRKVGLLLKTGLTERTIDLLYALAAEKSAWATREAGLEHQLRNLLAIIFRDGGQRAAAYPTLAEAVEAAHLEWAALVRERDEAKQAFLVIENDLHNINFKVLPNVRERAEKAEKERDEAKARHAVTERNACMWAERAERAEADAAATREVASRLPSGDRHDDDTLVRVVAADLKALRGTLSSTAGRDLLARMERMQEALDVGKKALSRLIWIAGNCGADMRTREAMQASEEKSVAQAALDTINGLEAALADQPGEKG